MNHKLMDIEGGYIANKKLNNATVSSYDREL